MAGPLDGLDLGAPSKPAAPVAAPGAVTTGPLSGIDLNAPVVSATPTASEVPWFSLSGTDKIGEFVGKMGDAATGGLLATALDKLGLAQGPNGQTVGQQVESAGKDIGPVASTAADLAGYAVGPGKFAGGERLAARLGGGYLARIGGSAAENAAASGVGTLGHGGSLQDAGRAATVGGLIGAATGAIPGAKGARASDVSPTSDLESTASQLYAPLKNKVYQTPDVEKAISSVSVPQGMQANMSKRLSDQIDRVKSIVAQGGQTTANDIAGFRRSLLGAATNDTDMTIAGQYVSALERGVGPKTAADIGAANAASNVAKTSGDIDNWITQAGADPAAAQKNIAGSLKDNPNFYKTVGDQLKAAAQAPGIGSKIATSVGKDAASTLAGGAIEGMFGSRDPMAVLAGGAVGLAGAHGAGALANRIRTNALVSKLAEARHLNATGETVPTSVFSPGIPVLGPLGAYARRWTPGLGASGVFAP